MEQQPLNPSLRRPPALAIASREVFCKFFFCIFYSPFFTWSVPLCNLHPFSILLAAFSFLVLRACPAPALATASDGLQVHFAALWPDECMAYCVLCRGAACMDPGACHVFAEALAKAVQLRASKELLKPIHNPLITSPPPSSCAASTPRHVDGSCIHSGPLAGSLAGFRAGAAS